MLSKRILVLMFLVVFLPLVGCIPSPAPPITENQAPVIISTPVITAKIGAEYTYNVKATDLDNDSLTYSLIVKPKGMTINSTTGAISWKPICGQAGDNPVIVEVSDGALSDTQSFTIKVSTPSAPPGPPAPPPVNHAPIITSIPSLTAIVGVDYVYEVKATDPDGDVLTYSLTVKPDDMGIDSGTGLISWIPTSLQIGTNDVTVKVSDGKKAITQSFTITVNPKTYTITATAGPEGSISPSGDVTVNESSDKLFTITPDSVFYSIKDVLVDGSSEGAVSTYTFVNVTEDHTINATFELKGRVYNQTKNLHYNIIQVAINDANPNNIILVSAWTYPENVTIGIIGVTLRASIKHEALIKGTVMITANDVTVDGFSIKDFSQIPTPDQSGVYMPSGKGILVVNNLIDGTGIDPVASLTVGIHTLYGGTAEATLEGNTIRNVRMGIYSQGDSLLIKDNTIEDTVHCGIGIDTALGTIITGNTISNCGLMGIEVFGPNVVANFNNITGNTNFGVWSAVTTGPQVDATNNWWGDASGPSGVGPGTGDAININVVYDPWSIVPH